jgi:sugar fermentation stimulation protein A
VVAALSDGAQVECHLADPGRLVELLRPGAPLRLRPAAGVSDRRTRFSVALVRVATPPRPWVSLESWRANRLAAELLETGRVAALGGGWQVRAEVSHGRSRFDFLLEKPRAGRVWIEVKSVTLVENGVARFPDAPTERGRRHVEELAALVRSGERALLLFVVQRADARMVAPHATIDPRFAEALSRARKGGVLLRAAGFRLDGRGRATFLAPLPVRLGA